MAPQKTATNGQGIGRSARPRDGNLRQKPDIGELTYGSAQLHAITRTADGRDFDYDADGRRELREGTGIRLGREKITYTEFGLPSTVRSGTSTVEERSYGYDAEPERVLESMATGEETVSWGGLYRRHKDLTGARRYGDKRRVKLLLKWLHAGVMDDGKLHEVTAGTPQGGIRTHAPSPRRAFAIDARPRPRVARTANCAVRASLPMFAPRPHANHEPHTFHFTDILDHATLDTERASKHLCAAHLAPFLVEL
jgi:hypothetical protein